MSRTALIDELNIATAIPLNASALEILEAIGEVKVERKLFSDGYMQVDVMFGKYGDIRLNVWATGKTISRAAENCVERLVKVGVLSSSHAMIEANA